VSPPSSQPLLKHTPLEIYTGHEWGARVAERHGVSSALSTNSSQKVIWVSAISSSLVGWWAVSPPEPLRGGAASPSVPGTWVPPVIPSEVSPWGWWEALWGPSSPSHLFQSKSLQTFSSLRLLCPLSATDVLWFLATSASGFRYFGSRSSNLASVFADSNLSEGGKNDVRCSCYQ